MTCKVKTLSGENPCEVKRLQHYFGHKIKTNEIILQMIVTLLLTHRELNAGSFT